ncbi:hypothetical protein ACKKBF_B33465 [Auxenochlorella protothecoides x Auxenochlorella symbiontica]
MQSGQLLLLISAFLGFYGVSAGRYKTDAGRVDGKLNVHLVCHTHDDAGWLKTVDQYYWGANNTIQDAGVQYILDAVVAALAANKDRKFTYAEMSFFQRWWDQQEEDMRDLVHHLVASGQLSFANGGYVQHDEAASHYVAMIDQTTRGHSFLQETFGVKPRVAWQLDPFGHSATQASLMSAEAGFDALFIARADHQDMDVRRAKKELEFIWAPNGTVGGDEDGIFTVNFASGQYGPPEGFGFEWGCPPIADDPRLKEYNVQDRVDAFVWYAQGLANVTVGNDVIVTMGSDFNYGRANQWFKNMDKLIHYVNADGRVNVLYSTPEAYVDAKHGYNHTWSVKRDDFFPYSDSSHAYWTGYFSSRPTSKRYIRQATSFLQAARQLELTVGGKSSGGPTTDGLEAAVSLTQHHDSITGTEKQHVANDYHERLSAGLVEAQTVVVGAVSQLLGGEPLLSNAASADGSMLRFCNYANATICEPSVRLSREGRSIRVVVYNPVAWTVRAPLRVAVSTHSSCEWIVQGPNNETLPSHTVSVDATTRRLQHLLHETNASSEAAGDAEVAWVADLQPLGLATFTMLPASVGRAERDMVSGAGPRRRRDEVLDNGILRLVFDAEAGSLKGIGIDGAEPIQLTTSLAWYNSSDGLDVPEGKDRGQAGGAYIFRPGNKTFLPRHRRDVELRIVKGEVVQEAHQRFGDWATLVTRLYQGQAHFEVEWTVGPIPVSDGLGKEVVLEYRSSTIRSGRTFHTDSNGRHMVHRERDHRPGWRLNVTEPVAGNYYPVTAAATIQDREHSLAVLVDRAQGAASLASGRLEFMLHRRLLADDGRGVAEALNETACGDADREVPHACGGLVARGVHRVLVQREGSGEGAAHAAAVRRTAQALVNDPPLVMVGPVQLFEPPPAAPPAPTLLALSLSGGATLPPDVQLLTLAELAGRGIVRVAHLHEAGEGGDAATPATFDLAPLLRSIKFSEVTEVSLTANSEVGARPRLRFNSGEDGAVKGVGRPPTLCKDSSLVHPPCRGGRLNITLKPFEVRTFELRLDSRSAAAA